MPTFTGPMASPKNWHVTFPIGARNANRDADVHRAALFFHLIGQSMNGQITLRRVILSANGKAI